MKKKRRLILFALALLVAVPLILPGTRLTLWGWLRGEPCYKGRPVSYWRWELEEWQRSEVKFLGDNGQAIDRRPEPWWHHRVSSPERVIDWFAGRTSRVLPYDMKPIPEPFDKDDPDALSILVELLTDPDVELQIIAAKALHYMGSNALPAKAALEEAARNEEYNVRYFAEQALKSIEPASRGE